MVNNLPCENTGTNLVPTKPNTTQIPTCIFGTPKGEIGRRGILIQGIIIHCIDESLSAYDAKMISGTSPPNDTPHGSLNYMVGSTGAIHQYVDDQNVSWGFDAYNDPMYPENAEITGITWPVLQGINGSNTSPDYYVLNIGLESGLPTAQKGCTNCPGPTVLQEPGYEQLVHLLAFLANQYQILIDTDHIQFHQYVDCNAVNECPCADINQVIQDVINYCEPCVSPVPASLPVYNPETDIIDGLFAKTEQNCCDDAGCQVCIPLDSLACIIGDLIEEGEIDMFVGVQEQEDGTYCLTKGVINVDSPIIGDGTQNNPLAIDRCAIEGFLPSGTILNVNGTDDGGCWIDENAQGFVQRLETPITITPTNCIDVTLSGQSDHNLQIDLIISQTQPNFASCENDGLLVAFDNCDLGNLIPENAEQELISVTGIDSNGCLVKMDDSQFVAYNICQFPVGAGEPTELLGKNNDECPVYYTPGQILESGIEVIDTDSIDLSLTPGNPVQISGDIVLSGPQNGVDNCITVIPGEGVYAPCVTFDTNNSECISLSIVDNIIEAMLNISPSQGGVGNSLQCLNDGAFVPTGANVQVNGPITGTGTELDPLDIDYTLLDAQDLCDFGGSIPVGILDMFVGIDTNNCLRVQNPNNVVFQTLTVQDGNCIDLNLINGDPNVLTAELIVAGAQGGIPNSLICIANQGAYVPVGAGLIFNDTSCIALDLTAGVVTANPIIAGAQNGVPNQLSCINGQGLYVPRGSGLIAANTDCISMSVVDGTISATPVIAPTLGGIPNALTCTGQGLYVPIGSDLDVNDSDCIDLSFVDGTLTADLIVSPAQGGIANQLSCIPGQGSYVPLGAGLNFVNSSCISITQISDVVSASPIISPDPGNTLECRPNGLFTTGGVGPIQDEAFGVQGQSVVITYGTGQIDPIPGVDTPNLAPVNLVLNNPSLDRNMVAQIVWTGYNADFSFQTANPLTARYSIQEVILVDAIPVSNPFSNDAYFGYIDLDTAVAEMDMPTTGWTGVRIIPPGGSVTVSVTATLSVISPNNATLSERIQIGEGYLSIQGNLV